VHRWAYLGVVTGVAVGLAFAGMAIWWSPAPSSPCPGSSSGGVAPLGSSVAFGTANEAIRGADHWYNFTIESGGSGIPWGGVSVRVVGPANTTPTSQWNLTVTISGVGIVAAYSFPRGGWSLGGTVELSSTQTLVLLTGDSNLTSRGDLLNVAFDGACIQGLTSANIP